MVVCPREPFYDEPRSPGLVVATNRGDGYSMHLEWRPAHPDSVNYKVAYNIYFSSIRDDIYSEGVKAVAVSPTQTVANLTAFTPGDLYYFSVRATEFDADVVNTDLLPIYTNSDGYLKAYAEGALLADMTTDNLSVAVGDIDLFPSYGIVQVGYELIRYTNVDVPNNLLIVSADGRGYLGSDARIHLTDGYDGYLTHEPVVKFWSGFEEENTVVFQAESRFAWPNVPYTTADGYRLKPDILTTDFTASDANQEDNSRYAYDGWHRTPPSLLLSGKCLDTYIGGERGCADGYGGIGNQVRGLDLNKRDQERLEMLLETTGEKVVLVKRLWKGITCSCVTISKETPELRCKFCWGTGIVGGYDQFFNSRRSDGRILVRFNPASEDLKMEDAGLESYVMHDTWTLAYPAIKDRDFIIRFNEDGTEEWRYEVLDVTRNKLLSGVSGRQTMKIQRVRKTSPIYQWRVIRDTSTIPSKLATTVGKAGAAIPPHIHYVTINENITSLSQINSTTSIAQDHSHPIINGEIQDTLNHVHSVILI